MGDSSAGAGGIEGALDFLFVAARIEELEKSLWVSRWPDAMANPIRNSRNGIVRCRTVIVHNLKNRRTYRQIKKCCYVDLPLARSTSKQRAVGNSPEPYPNSRLGETIAMRFMMLMIPNGYEKVQPGAMPDAKVVAAMMKYNEALQKAGVLLALDGLHPPSMGARVTFAGGKPTVTDGPFIEAKEVIGGYWMIQVNSKEEAVEWASRCPASDNEVIELRQVQEMSDFPAAIQEAATGFAELRKAS